jgi:hypothetical protein
MLVITGAVCALADEGANESSAQRMIPRVVMDKRKAEEDKGTLRPAAGCQQR